MRHASGKLTEVLYNASVFRYEKGEVAGVLAVARDITERKRAEQAEELARRDGLTNLYNHRTFYELLREETVRAQRFNRPVSLLMLDIDHFKRVNDARGHEAGDVILKGLSDLLMKQVRAVDHVCRYGGEEFTVILPETDTAVAMQIAERCARRWSASPSTLAAGRRLASPSVLAWQHIRSTRTRRRKSSKPPTSHSTPPSDAGRNRVCPLRDGLAKVGFVSPALGPLPEPDVNRDGRASNCPRRWRSAWPHSGIARSRPG